MSNKKTLSINTNPLIKAIASEDLDLIRVLLQQGESPIINIFSDTTPLEYAASQGNLSIVQELLNSDIDVRNWRVNASLVEAVSNGFIEIVKLFLDAGINVNEPINKDRHTVLMEAAGEGYLEIVKLLVERDADVNYLFEGESAIFFAINAEHKDIYDFLLPLITNQDILSILQEGYSNTLEKLDYSPKQHKDLRIELFVEAASKGDSKIIKREIKKGININATDSIGNPALSYAAIDGHVETVKILLDSGADPNGICRPIHGKSPYSTLMALTQSQGRNYISIMDLLIQKGADVNFTDSEGNTALFNLISYGIPRNCDEIELGVKFLYSAGADVNAINDLGESILTTVLKKGGLEKIVYFLELVGARRKSKVILEKDTNSKKYTNRLILP